MSHGARRRIAVVTDSTSSLAPDDGPGVVPLLVDDGDGGRRDGVEVAEGDVLAALRSGRRVLTSGPPPAAFDEAYAAAAAGGASGIVSVHLSGELSGTVHAAALAASRAPVPVRVVDSRTVARGLGFAVLAADRLARRGGSLDEVARRAARVADASVTTFLVDSLDHLRRGGRLSATAAALGTVLGVRPLLSVTGGRLEVAAKVRGRQAAVERLLATSLAAAAEFDRPAWAVHEVGAGAMAGHVADRMSRATGTGGDVLPVGPVLAAHVGPGVVAVVVTDLAGGG